MAELYIKDLFRPKEQITSLVLRDDGNKLAVPFPKTDCLKHSASYSGEINNLPISQRNATFFFKLAILRLADVLLILQIERQWLENIICNESNI